MSRSKMTAAPLACAAAILTALLADAALHPALAADPTGVWLTEHGRSRVRIARCNAATDALCGTVEWLKQPTNPATGQPVVDELNVDQTKRGRPILGIRIAIDMKPTSNPNRWEGAVYTPEEGRSYDGSLTLKAANVLRIEGCLLLICEGETWTRVGNGPPAKK